MSTITYNNLASANGLVTFSHVPNIIKIEEAAYDGVKAQLVLTLSTSSLAGQTGQTIAIGGEVITSVDTLQAAVNRNFYISSDNSATAYSIMKALRNCPVLAAGYDIWMADYDAASVTVRAKEYGPAYNMEYTSNFTAAQLNVVKTDGSLYNTSGLSSYSIDIYKDSDYITTLTKNTINDVQHFDVSPVLASMTEYGKLTPYTLKIHGVTSANQAVNLGTFIGNACYGYRLRGSANYLNVGYSNAIAAMDMARYIYEPYLDFSVIDFSSARWSATIKYLDSTGAMIGSAQTESFDVDDLMADINIELNVNQLRQSTTIEVTTPAGTQTYKVIKPLDAASYSQRVWWRNEYGGISFFDFTGQYTEKVTESEVDFQPSYYDYYDQTVKRMDLTFTKDIDTAITLTSHLIDREGLDLFRSLNSSHYVWTYVDGAERCILLTDLNISEASDVEDVFTVSITYKYSMKP